MKLTKISRVDLENVFKQYSSYIPDDPCTKEDLNEIIYQSERLNFFGLFFTFGIEYVLITLKYFEMVEDYSTCEEIVKQIKEQSIKDRRPYPTTLC